MLHEGYGISDGARITESVLAAARAKLGMVRGYNETPLVLQEIEAELGEIPYLWAREKSDAEVLAALRGRG
jgi:hypothetical protein